MLAADRDKSLSDGRLGCSTLAHPLPNLTELDAELWVGAKSCRILFLHFIVPA